MFKRTIELSKRPKNYNCPRCNQECTIGGYTVSCFSCHTRMHFSDYNLTEMESIYFRCLNYDINSRYHENKTYIFISERENILISQAVPPTVTEEKIKLYVLFS